MASIERVFTGEDLVKCASEFEPELSTWALIDPELQKSLLEAMKDSWVLPPDPHISSIGLERQQWWSNFVEKTVSRLEPEQKVKISRGEGRYGPVLDLDSPAVRFITFYPRIHSPYRFQELLEVLSFKRQESEKIPCNPI
jgi:hypothetical protein